jgi:hypothetical protein
LLTFQLSHLAANGVVNNRKINPMSSPATN